MMYNAILNNKFIATKAGEITVYNYDSETREYISASIEYLAVGVGIPAYSCLDAPAHIRLVMQSAVRQILTHGNMCQTIAVKLSITPKRENQRNHSSGDYPDNTTTIAPLTPYDKWNGEKWVTDTEAQHSAAVDAAEAQRQSLMDTAMASINLIQLKLQAGRSLTQAETNRLNTVLNYIDAVTATDTSTAPDIIWPVFPETD